MIKTSSKLTHSLDSGRLTLKPMGEIDHHSAVSLREEADAQIYRVRPTLLVIDLSSIDFMDSSGLGFIMGRYKLACKLNCKTVIKNPTARVNKILALAGMERIIKIERD